MHSDQTPSLAASDVVTELHGTRATNLSSVQESRAEMAKISTLVSRNVTIGGHRTSCRLEPFMWDALYDICARERMTIHMLCTRINERKDANTSLTAAIRVFALAYFRAASTEDGHVKASHGHGNPFTQTPFNNEEQPKEQVVNLRRSAG
jgi:predicted DNA-binding ribbon-helix-helix protein